MKRKVLNSKAILLSIFLTVFAFYATAQKVTLSFQNSPFEKVLNSIKQQTGLTLVFSEQVVDLNRKVSINVKSIQVEDALRQLLSGTNVSFEIKNNKLYLIDKKKSGITVNPQNFKKITGLITDTKGEPIIGATVVIKGQKTGTVTDINGKFSLETSITSQVQISYIGYITQTIKIDDKNAYNIILIEDSKNLDEVVVIGYGAIRKSDLTGAVASIKMDELNKTTPTLETALIGHTPGVEIKQTSGAPGAGTKILVRGVNSVYAGVEPLYVIDGYPASKDVYINPSDVASIEVLKDAASASIYGSRAAGGVVLITTKRGKEEKPKVELSYQFSTSNLLKKVELLNSKQFLELHKDAYNNTYFDFLRGNGIYATEEESWEHSRNDDNATRIVNGASTSMLLSPQVFNTDIDTDWQDAIFSSAPTHKVNFNIQGGKEGFKYMFSLGYLNQDGIIKPSNHDRITSRFNMDIDVNKKFSIGVNSSLSHVKEQRVQAENPNFVDGIVLSALGTPPSYPLYNEDGSYSTDLYYPNTLGYAMYGAENAVVLANEVEHRYTIDRYDADVNFKYEFIDGLYAKVTGGMQIGNNLYHYYRPAGKIGRNSAGFQAGDFVNVVNASNNRDYSTDALLEATLNFNRQFGKHRINSIAGYSMQQKDYDNVDIDAKGFTSDRIREISGAGSVLNNIDGTSATSDLAAWSLMSMFTRIIYSYDDRYTFSASIRGDGCSRFGPENRGGYFPSASGAWILSNEKFWEDIKDVFTVKFRASWGISGNNNISNYRHIPLIGTSSYNFGTGTVTGYQPSGFTDVKLGWEKTKQTNIGLDLGFFNGRVNLIANYYNSVTTDLLYSNTVPAITGSTSYWTNLTEGDILNTGFDLQLDINLIATQDFRWNISGNISANRNKIDGLKDEIIAKAQRSQITHITRNGLPIGSYYGMVSQGLITKEDYEKIKIDAQHRGEAGYQLEGPPVADYGQVYIGDVKWKDITGDGKITEDDRDIIGKNYPDFTYGASTSFSYKGFNLSASFDGRYGGDIINFNRYYIGNMEGGSNAMTIALNRYRDETNQGDGMIFRANRTTKNLNTKFSTYFVEDGSFFRCTNLTLGYNVPENRVLKTMKIGNIYLYAAADNLFMLTSYSGYNPDVDLNGTAAPGVDFGTYPLSRTFSVGVNLTF